MIVFDIICFLVSVSKILNNIKGINFNYFDSSDVVRSNLAVFLLERRARYV